MFSVVIATIVPPAELPVDGEIEMMRGMLPASAAVAERRSRAASRVSFFI
jgi:hypothetical protein